jgi:SAM-dependent methyltransferase
VEAGARDLTAPQAPALTSKARSWTLALYGAAIFLAAALVFAVQPMVAKMLLPHFGGTPAVWVVSLVFFQTALLGGYAFAHYSLRLLGVRRQSFLQLGLLLVPLVALPIAVSQDAGPGDNPHVGLLWALVAAAGLPFFVVTTASPVLQRWFSECGDTASRDPYFLYAAGNAGSLLGLLAYPVLIEPLLTLSEQATLWTAGYAIFVLLAALCTLRLLGAPAAPVAAAAAPKAVPKIARLTAVRWIGMAALPSALMVATTTYLSTDIAAVPLLWVIPLALYLLSFIVAFARSSPFSLRAISWATVVTSLLLLASLMPIVQLPIWAVVSVHGANLFFVALLVHRRLAIERPPAERLTQFYLLLSLGGVCGGIFSALVAPAVFSTIAEYPIAIVLALLLRPGSFRPRPGVGFVRRNADLLLPFALLAVVLVAAKATPEGGVGNVLLAVLLLSAVASLALFAGRPLRFALGVGALLLIATLPPASLHSERTFFGVLRVEEQGDRHVLVSGTTVHGAQSFAPGRHLEPASYYVREGPLGQLFEALDGQAKRVAVIGLGAGGASVYGRRGERWTFYEIDEAVARIAENPRYFTFLRDAKADIRVVLGDGRLKLAEAPDHSFDLFVLDAFSSDSVPVHLLTREAIELYLRKLSPDGLMAFHISNRYLDLRPVVSGNARSLGLPGLSQSYAVSQAAARDGAASSIWILVARNRAALGTLVDDPRWKRLDTRPGQPVWTDEFSNILSVVRWLH